MSLPIPYRESVPAIDHNGGVTVLWAASATRGPVRGAVAPHGSTVAELVRRALSVDDGLPPDFAEWGMVTIDGVPVPSQWWSHTRPRCGHPVVLHRGLHNPGGGQGRSNPLQILATIALIALTFAVGAGALGGVLGAQFAAGTLGAKLLAAGLLIGGTLAIGALSPPPQLPPPPQAGKQAPFSLGSAGAGGNALAPDEPLPRLAGTRRLAPPLVAFPYVEISGDDEIVEAVYGLAGPTRLEDVWFGGLPVETLDGVEIELYENKPGDAPLSLINRQTATDQPGVSVSRHITDPVNGGKLSDQTQPERSLPIWHSVSTHVAPDELVITLTFDGGLIDSANVGAAQAVPMRIRFRERGKIAWVQGPEVHFASSTARPFHKYVRLIWEAPPLFTSQAPSSNGPIYAFKAVPAQSAAPPRGGWQADSYFAGAGGDLMNAATFGSHGVRNVSLDQDGVTLHLDPTVFPQGTYEVGMIFGAAYGVGNFTASSYQLGGKLLDLFGFYYGSGSVLVPSDRSNISDQISIPRAASIWHEPPFLASDCAGIMVRARNQQLGELTVKASGLVPQWDGAAWSGLDATLNPAPHFRDRLARLYDPEVIDDDSIVQWLEHSAAQGYEISAVLAQGSAFDALNLIASAGFARLRSSETWGVIVDRDTSAEAPTQTFSPWTTRGFAFDAAFPLPIGGLRATFADREQDHKPRTIIVRNPRAPELSLPLEAFNNDAQDTEEAVTKRALFDMIQAQDRMVAYSFDVPSLGLAVTRGDLCAVNHDMLADFTGAGRIRAVLRDSGGLVTGLKLFGTVKMPSSPAWSDTAAAWSNYAAAWASPRYGCAIRLTDRSELKLEIVPADETDTLTLVTPLDAPAELTEGCHLVVGLLGSEYLRMRVFAMTYKNDLEWTLTCVDEAAGMFAEAGL